MSSYKGSSACLLALSLLVPGAGGVGGAKAEAETLLVHLPSVPIESSSRLANAVTSFADYLNAHIQGLSLEVKMFRRWEDAYAFYQSDPNAVTAILSESSFLLDLPRDDGFVPGWRFARNGDEFYRRLVIVRAEDESANNLSDLRGKHLTFVKTTGEQSVAFLGRSVFGGEVAPDEWFSGLEPVTDDFTAVAAVVHGQVDAALVADHNPLLRADLGPKLKEVYTSPRQSNPVFSIRSSAFDGQRETALAATLSDIAETPEGASMLSELLIDGFRPIRAADRQALVALPSASRKRLQVALPTGRPSPSLGTEASALAPSELTFTLAIELPETAPVSTLHASPAPEPEN